VESSSKESEQPGRVGTIAPGARRAPMAFCRLGISG
jgi:hypothetical protein